MDPFSSVHRLLSHLWKRSVVLLCCVCARPHKTSVSEDADKLGVENLDLRVESFLETDSGYPKDKGVALVGHTSFNCGRRKL